jgi:hypothetical protein
MKPHRPNALGQSLVRFFQEYLPTLRGMSQHTIHGYRDAVVLFLRYLAEDSGRPVDRLDLSDINAVSVSRFLTFIEEKRGNSINTRNARLAAIHTFSRFLANDYPEHMVEWQRVLALPFKRGATQAPIEYLEADVSRPLQPSVRFLRAPLPTAPTAFLAVRLPLPAVRWAYPVPHEFPSGADPSYSPAACRPWWPSSRRPLHTAYRFGPSLSARLACYW